MEKMSVSQKTCLRFQANMSHQICHRCTIFRQTPAIYSSFPYVFLFRCSSLAHHFFLGKGQQASFLGYRRRPASADRPVLRTFFLSSNSGVPYTCALSAYIHYILQYMYYIYILYYTTSFASYTHFNSVRQSWKKSGKKAKDRFVGEPFFS